MERSANCSTHKHFLKRVIIIGQNEDRNGVGLNQENQLMIFLLSYADR